MIEKSQRKNRADTFNSYINERDRFMRPKLPKLLCLATLMAPGAALAHTDHVTETALAKDAIIVECTLEDGSAAQCAQYTVTYLPDDLEIGPFCPATQDDEGGIWDWDGENTGVYRIDAAFLQMLAEQGYTFYNDAGEVNVFDIRTEGPTEPNECISASVDESVEMTLLIPLKPVMADAPTELGTVAKVGVGVDGVPIFADAPSVLETGHMPALDTCGGHVDPGGWYHWHATATDIDTVFETEGVAAACENVTQDQTAVFGYAFDGFAMLGTLEIDGSVPTDVDDCGGHVGIVTEGEPAVYHYHASDTFPNLPTCLVGVVAQDNFSTTAEGGIGSANIAGPGGPPDFSAIAAALGVEVSALEDALQAEGGRNADLAKVAERIGVTEEALTAAMPRP